MSKPSFRKLLRMPLPLPFLCPKHQGFTLLDLLIATAIIAILASIALPAYSNYIQKARISSAIVDIKGLEISIRSFAADNDRLPANLAEIHKADFLDPWGHPYQYLNIENNDIKGKGSLRKDRNLVPINSDYDLYSMGADGETKPPLTAKASQDDIIRANNGVYVGLASSY